MGICISYKGRLSNPEMAPLLIANMRSLCCDMNWWHCEMADLVARGMVRTNGLVGISLSPHPECEPLHLHFDRLGRLVNHFYYAIVHDEEYGREIALLLADNQRRVERLLPGSAPRGKVAVKTLNLEDGVVYNWTKTQFGGPLAHAAVCRVLAFVKKHYAPDLEVDDDTGFFDHGKLDVLERQMARVGSLIAAMKNGVEHIAEEARRHPEKRAMTLGELMAKLDLYMRETNSSVH